MIATFVEQRYRRGYKRKFSTPEYRIVKKLQVSFSPFNEIQKISSFEPFIEFIPSIHHNGFIHKKKKLFVTKTESTRNTPAGGSAREEGWKSIPPSVRIYDSLRLSLSLSRGGGLRIFFFSPATCVIFTPGVTTLAAAADVFFFSLFSTFF